MGYVMVSADFPNVTEEKRNAIYECLKKKQWVKVENVGRDISTTWYASFKPEVTESSAINETISDFESCASPCKPKLVIHFGVNRPTKHGL